ncbi:MAG: M15 family metallopeptidase [Bacteroides sp.]|nr:M15 family metallopeptidase [Prevotella sp.]MCM1407493.1 M15 family metallopeptidase [Treponema brennaborense]MCM1469983.1 M15 family metallopeptidase [Bacteroides sp.]
MNRKSNVLPKAAAVFAALLLCPILFSASRGFRSRESVSAEAQEQSGNESRDLTAEEEFGIFREAYPSVQFELGYDEEIRDWTLSVTSYGRTTVFYRCGGLYLPKEELANSDHYWRVIYNYRRELRDPADFTEEEKQRIRNYGSDENRRNGAVSAKFIFDAIYDCDTRHSAETHLRSMTLWKKTLNVNRDVSEAVKRAEAKVYELAETDAATAEFLQTLGSCYGYNWRQIRDSPTKSFHSYGIALDILPRGWTNKIVYWNYEKQKGNADWMLIPLKDRWLPPPAVVKVFEDEGFIWGGRWAVWDNMHFEYHPELLLASKIYEAM